MVKFQKQRIKYLESKGPAAMDVIGIRRVVLVKMLIMLVTVGVHANDVFPPYPSPSPSPLSPQQDMAVKYFDLPCFMKWAPHCRIFLSSSFKFKSFEGCLDAIKIHCARPLSEVTHKY
jgi:hypothetical protein